MVAFLKDPCFFVPNVFYKYRFTVYELTLLEKLEDSKR